MSFAEAAIRRLVPAAFREFLPFVSPSGLRVIHKERVLAIALDCVGRSMSTSRYDEEFARVAAAVADSPLAGRIEVVREISEPLDPSSLTPAERAELGETILELYFLLVSRSVAFFIDLRPEFFHRIPGSGKLQWRPSRLWFSRSAEFATRIGELYRGFFRRSPEGTANGIALYRWDATPTEGFDARMEALMRQHFGDAESANIRFSMDHFRSTFHLIFEEAIASRSRFHPELSFIGAALAGLYVTLELVGEPLDVARAYAKMVGNA